MTKKASLELSMNAIVVLILAITMLGLGLTFMRGLFKQATERVEAAVSSQELTNPPTRDSPLTAAPGEVSTRASDKPKILLAFMNTESENNYCQLHMEDEDGNDVGKDCTTGCGDKIAIYNDDVSGAMSPEQINVWTLVIDPADVTYTPPTATTATFVLSANICCKSTSATSITCGTTEVTQYKKDILVTVKK